MQVSNYLRKFFLFKREARLSDLAFFSSLTGVALFTLGLFVFLFIFLYLESKPALRHMGFQFFNSSSWSPATETYGGLAFVYGTLMSSLVALIISVPVSVATALFLTELSPKKAASVFRVLLEMLAAIPSVIYGLWGIFVLVPFVRTFVQPFSREWLSTISFFQGPPFGIGLFSAGLILAIMITPTITSLSVEVFKSIPNIYREGAKALGATSWEVMKMAVLKPGSSGLFAAITLGLGRAMGETMAVAMVIGNRADIPLSLFSPAATMSSVIANEYAESSSDLHLSALTAVGFNLLLISMIVNGLGKIILLRLRGKVT